METFTRRQSIIEAKQWYVDGDHEEVFKTKSQGEKFDLFPCPICKHPNIKHGWLETNHQNICPGDWIIYELSQNYYYRITDERFKRDYIKIEL